MLEIGSLVDGKYKILNKVGQGGMSVVYLAMNEKANKQWAVKEVRKDGVLDFEAVKQGLVAETDILKKLDHPNLPSIVDVIDTDESFIIIMDYIQGNSLSKALEEFGAQPQENVIEWAKQLCDVLGYLHSQNPPIIYRDMKPANVMLKPDGNVTLIDFGTAREYKEKNLADTTCLGTIGYAAPEQFGGMGQTDARTDIYCLGATLYHLVTGMNPCEPPYEIKPIRQINPNLSSGLERIILKCTQRDPNDRYQSAAELMYALEHYEEIDDIYRSKQKKKLITFLIPAALTLIFAGVSIWGYVASQNKMSENYDSILAAAKSAQTEEIAIERYKDAIRTDPSKTEAYIGSGELLSDDGGLLGLLIKNSDPETADEIAYKLTSDESTTILNKLDSGLDVTSSGGYGTTVKALEELRDKNPDGYLEVCSLFGDAHLYFYNEGKETGEQYLKADYWYRKVITDSHYQKGSNPMAEVCCDIADCINSIKKAKQFAPDTLGGHYERLWELFDQYNENAEASSLSNYSKLRIWTVMAEYIELSVDDLSAMVQDSENLSFAKYVATLSTIRREIEKLPSTSQTAGEIAALKDKLDRLISKFQRQIDSHQ